MNEKGFTLVEAILSMYIVSVAILFISAILLLLSNQSFQSYKNEDENSMQNVRRMYVLSELIEMDGDMLSFRYFNQDMYFQMNEDKLILKEGYQVYFRDLEYAYFKKNKECVYIVYKREKEEEKERIIGC